MSAVVDEIPGAARWWARAAALCVLVAIVLPIAEAGVGGAVLLVVVGIAGVAITLAAIYWFLSRRGAVRAAALVLAVVVPIAVLALYIHQRHLWVVVVAGVFVALALVCARAALRIHHDETGQPEYPAAPVEKPFLVMNPRSGGGKVVKFDLQRKAEALGATVALLDGPEPIDVEALALEAVARGADLLGVAGGDGTQALVAGIAAAHDIPFLVISAGTRNHFALDLGLDRDDPAAGLDALRDGVELRVDLGDINGRTFVNNASFGVYADIVQSPNYRDDKTGTVLDMLPDLLAGDGRARLRARIDGELVDGPQAILVSNGPYTTDDLAGMGRRTRLDRGRLGVVAISVSSARQAVGLLNRARSRGLVQRTATEVVVDADTPDIPVGVDGEALRLPTPVRCTITPGALRVRVPRNRPGVRLAAPALDWVRLRELALPRRRTSPVAR
ncbi:diacylglycerol kinase [Rhodococcus sp. HM1]|uniref:diacylglycerol/lipid kinase family protein n=1 Tax=Rhodococcus sp. HM1 TaxID=2937759 RepID=UPI00200AFDF1|nr:diacylglycerol kinase family protein [Rhodococcus sp. HM1]MCK8674740.1 diacylglycerol kinase [Rhodococcus sp. HM1]